MNTKNVMIILAIVVILLFGWMATRDGANTQTDTGERAHAAAAETALSGWHTYRGGEDDSYTLRYPSGFSINDDERAAHALPATAFLVTNSDNDCTIRTGFHLYGAEGKSPFAVAPERKTATFGDTDYNVVDVRNNEGQLVVINATARRDYTGPKPHSFYVTNYDKVSGTYREISSECNKAFDDILATYEPVAK